MKKYLIYKISGGLCHMLGQINNLVHFCKTSDRILVLDCNDGAFKSDFSKYFYIPGCNYVTSYDILYADNSIDKILLETYINGKMTYNRSSRTYYLNDKIITSTIEDLSKSDDQMVCCTWLEGGMSINHVHPFGDIPWYIKVNKEIVNNVSINKINEKYIGFHYRNTDMRHVLETYIPKIIELSNEITIIYLGTDDYTAYDRLSNLLPKNYNIIQYTKPMNNNGQNIHYGNPNKDEVIMNALTDMYHLIYATYFIPSSSNSAFSSRISQLRKDDTFFTEKIVY